MKSLKSLIAIILISATTIPTLAVTDKEMEEARAITAKAYLRYANDGSGYLDEINPKSMAELTSKLKEKEKENLKAFNSVKVPTNYSQWDKEKLVEFWAVTFFTSPALTDKGKVAKSRVRKQISSMTISAPSPATSAPTATPAPTPEASKSETAAAPLPETTPADTPEASGIPTAQEVIEQQEDILKDQSAIEKDAEEGVVNVPREESHTWVYVLVLVLLVAVVVWLVFYAARLMKRQPDDSELPASHNNSTDTSDIDTLRDQTRRAIAKKNEELEQLKSKLSEEEQLSARLRSENEMLRSQIASLKSRTSNAPKPQAARPETPAPQTQPQEQKILNVIYLGRANARGLFVRADRRLNPGNTIYRLDTNDGLVGTFHVIDQPDVVEAALNAPIENLANGCTGEDLADTAGVTHIITESAGTALFENGCWRVLRKTKIRYE